MTIPNIRSWARAHTSQLVILGTWVAKLGLTLAMDDPALQMILADFEILSGADIFGNPRCNLLVTDLTKHDEVRIFATVVESPFGHLRNLDNVGFEG